MAELGRTLMVLGLVIAAIGLALAFGGRLPIRLGRLPGDIVYKGRNTTLYVPIVTCLLLSAVLTFVMWLLSRGRR